MDENLNEPWRKKGDIDKQRKKSEFRKDLRLGLYLVVTLVALFKLTDAINSQLEYKYFSYDGYILRYSETDYSLCFIAVSESVAKAHIAVGYIECEEVSLQKEAEAEKEFQKLLSKK